MHLFNRMWTAALILCVALALPTSTAMAASFAPRHPHMPQRYECQFYTETDNIQVNGARNPFNDDLGNQWAINYDIQVDNSFHVICGMRMVIRIFNPGYDGSWSGRLYLAADVNGVDDPNSHGTVSGSGTYQYHFVWRGPWFYPAYGSSIHIQCNEFNGSSQHGRAAADFSV